MDPTDAPRTGPTLAGDPVIEEGFRLQAMVAAEAFLRMLRAAVDAYGDLDSLNVYLSVVAASSGAVRRDPVLSRRYGGRDPVPDAYIRPVSRRAIALSTGLSRETTRRKVAQLVAAGHLVEERRGVRHRSNVLLERENLGFARDLMHEFERTAERLRRIAAESGNQAP